MPQARSSSSSTILGSKIFSKSLSFDDINNNAASLDNFNGSISIAIVIMSVNFSLDVRDGFLEGCNHVIEIVEKINLNFFSFDSNFILESSNFSSILISFSLGYIQIGSQSFHFDFEIIIFSSDSVNLVSVSLDLFFKISNLHSNLSNSGIISGNNTLTFVNTGFKSALSCSCFIKSSFIISDNGFNLSQP